MDLFQCILTIVAIVGIAFLHILLRQTISSYASEKGKNLATKEDISAITHLIESTKISLQQRDRYEAKRYELKYQACLKALAIVDAQISHVVKSDNQGNSTEVDKQYATAEEIRSCHNELILSLDNSAVVSTFIAILTGSSTNAIADLDKLRGLVRAELGFPGSPHTDEEKTWIGRSVIKAEA